MTKKKRSHFEAPEVREIALVGLQVKSFEKAKLLAGALDVIEVECGIGSVQIRVRDVFVCPDIDWHGFSTTPMETLVQQLLTRKPE